ncbi:BAI1-associated protein 3 isoform X2 [Cimex lectularius]|uniref:BAI1-associated protein 3 n=1 Tax=Cimex lectularius TaxID=79782 RepID=A0A8I6SQR3_CIMLE|nr:BAI1-associated protein 3 isoform X2 [Cimex lectularius]
MSFFSSLQQMVSSGVANLSLSPKRHSISKESGGSGPPPPVGANEARSASIPGFPRLIPPHPAAAPVRRKTIDQSSTRRSFKGNQEPPGSRQPLVFCRRRLSWPEVDLQATSGVQETDGSFFESYTAVSWKLENRRLMRVREVDGEEVCPPRPDNLRHTTSLHPKEMEQLYVEVLYTITNKVGAASSQYYQEDLFGYAQRAFGVGSEQHRRAISIASEEKPPIVVLNVIVLEAEGLEAKDANGYSDPYCLVGVVPGAYASTILRRTSSTQSDPSQDEVQTIKSPVALIASMIGFSDPYCMLGIQPGAMASPPPPSPCPRMAASRAMSEGGLDPPEKPEQHHDKLRKHHSFRLSFKRKDRREHRDSISSAVPAKFIRATSVRPQTLNPRWNEKFRFDIDDVTTDILHLDIWDHDDESSVFDAVSKLNEVRGVKGLGRFFKQIAQSARSGSQDDFLGCVNVPLQDIPATGLDCWYKLEARTQRSNIQGRIRLKLWLSTREDRGTSEEDNWEDMRQQVKLTTVFANYEMSRSQSKIWTGELPHVALSILHQHAIQGDLTDLQVSAVRWIAYSALNGVEPQVLARLLSNLEHAWPHEALTRQEEEYLAESFNTFLEYAFQLIKNHRTYFPHYHRPSMNRLENLLRCLGLLANMKAFWKCCPFNKEIRGEIITSLKKGTLDWYEEVHRNISVARADPDSRIQGLVKLITALIVDLQKGIDHYNPMFESTNGVPYFSAIYKQLEKLVTNDLGPEIHNLCQQIVMPEVGDEAPVMPPGVEMATSIFELYLSIQEFASFRESLPDKKSLAVHLYYQWFEPAVDKWLDLAKFRAMNRIKKAAELNRFCSGDYIVKHSTSAVDTSACFYQMKEFWKQLAWPDLVGSYNLLYKLIDSISSGAIYYSQITQQKLQDTGYYEDTGPFKTTDEMCVAMNDLEYVRRTISLIPDEVGMETVLEAVEAAAGPGVKKDQWRKAITAILDQAVNQLEADITMVITRLGVKMCSPLKKAMFHLAWSPDSLPTEDAINPLLEYLDTHLLDLNAALLPKNFERVLSAVWDVCLLQLGHQMDGSAVDRMAGFYDRLYDALDILVDFFHADGKGLTLENIKLENYRAVEQRLQYHKTETEQLINLYYTERLFKQISVDSTEYGVLSVRAYFHHDSLCVEVLNARDVIPLDPNGFSDPFVIVELLPKCVFPHCTEQETKVQKKTLNPYFDECFEFSVTLDQCKSEGAMICFTVMDHDVLTANDFAGECFLSLSSIPGVSSSASADNFHGLKLIELPLMQQKDKNHPILKTLETRTWDKQALDFVKKQKLRMATS